MSAEQHKETLFVEVWKHLQSCPVGVTTLLPTLTAPTGHAPAVRNAWNKWRENGGSKKKGLQAILQERPDLFVIETNARNHLMIGLTETAKQTIPSYQTISATSSEGQGFLDFSAPAPGGASSSSSTAAALLGSPLEQAGVLGAAIGRDLAERYAEENGWDAAIEDAERLVAEAEAEAEVGVDESPEAKRRRLCQPTAKALPSPNAPRKAPQVDLAALYGPEAIQEPDDSGFLDFFAPTPNSLATPVNKPPGIHLDLIWSPAVAYCQQRDRRKDFEFIVAMYRLMDGFKGKAVALSQIGGDYTIGKMRKDPLYSKYKLVELVRSFKDWFEVVPGTAGGGFSVQLVPGAQERLPACITRRGISTTQGIPGFAQGAEALPEHIDDPKTMVERLQALRIEIIHALAKRGNKVPVQDLGQDTQVQQAKQRLTQGKKLLDLVKVFPNNFKVNMEVVGGQSVASVELLNPDVADLDPVDKYILRTYQAQQSFGGGRGYGYGYNHNNNNKGRGKGQIMPAQVPRVVPATSQIFMPGSSYGTDPTISSAVATAETQAQAQYLAQIAAGQIGSASIPQVGFSPQIL